MIICPPDGIELPAIDEMDCFEIELPKRKYKSLVRYLGVKGTNEEGNYIHQFEFVSTKGLIESVLTVESIDGIKVFQEFEMEFEA